MKTFIFADDNSNRLARKTKFYELENVEIQDISSEGKGIAKVNDKVIFVDKAITGDIVNIQSRKSHKSYETAKVLEFVEESTLRREPHCIHYEQCGGCKMQHLNYAEQVQWKQTVVQNAIERIGGFKDLNVSPIIGAEKTEGYRNKLDYAVSNKRWLSKEEISGNEKMDRSGIGFHLAGMFDKVLDIHDCHHMPTPNNEIRNFIRQKAFELDISFFDIREKHGCLRGIIFRRNIKGEWMVCFQVFDMEAPFLSLLEAIKNKFPEIVSLQYAINKKANDTIYDLDFEIYHGSDFIYEYLGDKKFRITPKSFFQTNSEQCVKLYNLIGELADIKSNDIVYDLYCGVGSIGIYLAEKAKKVVGIELVEEAIKDAKYNAELNSMKNCEYYAADMKTIFSSDFIGKVGRADIIITDPPRAGMHPDVVQELLQSGCPKIVYVSCNPQTMSKDLKELAHNYKICSIQALDMFPHTVHIETVVLLVLR